MNMKKIFTGILAVIIAGSCLVSCQDRLEDEYLNPEKTPVASIDRFFTKMLDHRRIRADYWNIRTFLNVHPGVYTNIISYTNSPRRYEQQLSYLDDYWKDYYTPNGDGVGGIVSHMREIEKQYNTLTAEEKAKADVFVQAARIIYFDQTSQVVDQFGDIPFSEAGMLNFNGSTAPGKFDDAEEIYGKLIDGLGEAAAYFRTAALESTVATSFSKQDLLLKGNLDKWERYANSIKMRLLMRISFQNEDKAKTGIQTMLNDPATYPLVDDAQYNVLLDPVTTYTSSMINAVTELTSHIAPEFLLDEVLKPATDPRIRVLFDKNSDPTTKIPNADYYAMPADMNSTDQIENINSGNYAVLDSSTFLYNTKFPGIVITSAEVNFLKAEAHERWGNTSDAQAAYEKGVTDAINFAFELNRIGTTFRELDAEEPVTADEVADVLASPVAGYAGTTDEKLQKIWLQKWVSFGFIQSNQAWAEYRRTNYPELAFVPDNGTAGNVLPPSRLLYPGSEKVFNAANYQMVQSSDTRDTKIFWDIN
jgi:hypothetical protein